MGIKKLSAYLGGLLTGSLMLDGGEAAEGVESSGSTWIRLKSGLQICWGTITIPANSAGATQTLPAPFADTGYRCAGSYTDIEGTPAVFYVVAPLSASVVKALAAHSSGKYDWERGINFIAIGKWK